MSLTEFHLKPLNENQCDQYHQLLEGSKELPENSNLQELSSLFNERISHLRNNNNHHNHTFIYRNRVIFIGLLIITCCIIFPAIFFVCYTALHCQIKQDGLNETMTTNRFISDESSYYILNNNNNTNLLNSLHTLTFPSAFPTSTNDTTFINSSLLNISKIETLNQSNFSSVKQNPVNLDFGIFDEPSEKEYENVIRFLKLKFNNFYAYTKSDQDISLDNKSWSEQFRMNILWSLSLHIPNKKERTAYFNRLLLFKKQAVFKRYGIVIILCGSCKRIPQIREYLVGPLSQPIKLKLLNIYPFYKRPLTNIEYNAILDFLTIQTNRIDHIIQDAYSASYFMQNPLNNFWLLKNRTMNESKSLCQKQNYKNIDNVNGRPNCLIPTFASPLVTNQTPRRRCIWIRLSREVAPFIQYPVDVQFYIDLTSLNPNEWTLLRVWFQGHLFSSLNDLINKYQLGELKIVKRQFIDMYPNQLKPDLQQYRKSSKTGSDQSAQKSTSPPQMMHPIRINKRRIQYEKWDFHVTLRRDTGIRLYGVYYANVSLFSEAGLDETVTAYWGRSPFMQTMTSLESMYGIGGMTSELSPGLDCPQNAIYLPVQLIPSGEIGSKLIKNAICLFEWKAGPYGGPVRRHFEFSTDTSRVENQNTPGNPDQNSSKKSKHTNFGFGTVSHSLVLRSISSLYNYDYLFDIIFYPTGTLEFSVTPTGFIHVDEQLVYGGNSSPEAVKYGFASSINPIYFVIHHHLFHFKIDVDIVNSQNFIKVISIHGSLTDNNNNNNQTTLHTTDIHNSNNYSSQLNNSELLWMSIDIPKNELSARYTPKFELPRQYLICSMQNSTLQSAVNKTKNDQCLMIMNKGQIKTIFNDEHTKSFAWSRHQLYVTQQHDNESFASSIFNGVDLTSPVVDFTKFSSNNESIFNEDLVLWLTVGNYHIPRHEDLPNTVTSGGPMSIFLMPHNLFTYSPEAFSCHRFYTQELDEWIEGPQMKDNCQMASIPVV